MRTAIVCYDLKNVKSGDNARVKERLELEDTATTFQALNVNSLFPDRVNLHLPNTRLYLNVSNPSVTSKQIANDVYSLIQSVGATPDKVYVAFITEDFIFNAP
ncbi:hypothetical protein H6G97_48860 [Nostoc flagelliforme FACHB-838]|uniref:Uncharacterized protein n=1 Tax=Nostoc flagelliforme FACHB-838 TaxID=2692904 RepID=A0ABR8E6L3_9NOSO|nr:hypothetical protein [Nostoc flagelliforme]MBD2536741.1 hypothetical protein [Nostoc flagelliforme FACHB-838]